MSFEKHDKLKMQSDVDDGGQGEYSRAAMEITADIALQSFWVRSRNRTFSRLIANYCKESGFSSFFELGCATGDFLNYLNSHVHWLKLSGSDNMPEAVHAAQTALPEIQIFRLDAKQLDRDNEIDAIGAFDLLEHITEDELVMSQAFQALKPGGLFFMSVPQHKFMWSQLDEKIQHKRRYGRQELIKKLKETGFQIEYITSLVTLLFPAMVLQRFIVDRAVADKDDEDISPYVSFNPLLNAIFDKVMRIDEFFIHRRISLPFGGTLVAVARKPI